MQQTTGNINASLSFRNNEPLDAPAVNMPDIVINEMAIQIWKRIMNSGLFAKAVAFLDSLPDEIATSEKVLEAKVFTLKKLERIKDGAAASCAHPSVSVHSPAALPNRAQGFRDQENRLLEV